MQRELGSSNDAETFGEMEVIYCQSVYLEGEPGFLLEMRSPSNVISTYHPQYS